VTVTFDTDTQSLDDMLRVIESLYDVRLTVERRQGRGGRKVLPGGPKTSDVRAWALSRGYLVSDRGRIPQSIIDSYVASTKQA
jgi:hypothetical protein